MEHGGMGCIIIGTEYLTGSQNLDGKLLGLHGMNLCCGGLCRQQKLRRQIEGILHISCGMVLWCIQCSKVIIIVLNFLILEHLKAHTCEDINNLVSGLGNGMQIAGLYCYGGHGYIQLLGCITLLHFLCLHPGIHLFELSQSPFLQLVDALTVLRTLLWRNVLHFLHQLTDLSGLGIHKQLTEFIHFPGAGLLIHTIQDFFPNTGKSFIHKFILLLT